MNKTPISRTLSELLDANIRFSLHAKGTTNHCPMALVALASTGADAQGLRQFFDAWEVKYAVVATEAGTPVCTHEWQQQLGKSDSFAGLRACFQAWIQQEGADQVLTQVLTQIPFAPATGAFHALICTAYGLDRPCWRSGEWRVALPFLSAEAMQVII